MEKNKVVVLHSGGLDSTTCILLALEMGKKVISLGINYGQRNFSELTYAEQQCHQYNLERKVVSVEWDKPVREIPTDRTIEAIKGSVSKAFLPGRNTIFLALACAEAVSMNASEVWIGINSIDFSGYPDCTPDFFEAFQKMMMFGIPNGPKIVAPLLLLSKPQIAKEAHRLGLKPGQTMSCYRPQKTTSGVKVCGKCDACVLHKYAWDNA